MHRPSPTHPPALVRVTERHTTGEHRTRWGYDRVPMPHLDALRRATDTVGPALVVLCERRPYSVMVFTAAQDRGTAIGARADPETLASPA